MKVLLTRVSDYVDEFTNDDIVEVNTIEDLLNLDKNGDGLIIWKKDTSYHLKNSPQLDADFEVEIYDDYRE